MSTKDAQYKNTKRENKKLKKVIKDMEDSIRELNDEQIESESCITELRNQTERTGNFQVPL